MASAVGSEVVIEEVCDVQIQEVEVEPIPIEMPIETVETSGETMEVQPMIALQPLPEPVHEEIVLQTAEEVVGDSHLVYVDNDSIPVPVPEIEICTEDAAGSSKRRKTTNKKGVRGRSHMDASLQELILDSGSTFSGGRKWEQKQVQIKTLEGEFSVTMWASGVY